MELKITENDWKTAITLNDFRILYAFPSNIIPPRYWMCVESARVTAIKENDMHFNRTNHNLTSGVVMVAKIIDIFLHFNDCIALVSSIDQKNSEKKAEERVCVYWCFEDIMNRNGFTLIRFHSCYCL